MFRKMSLVALLLVASCTNLTFDQKLQNGYDLNVAARDVATQAVTAKRFSSAQGTEVLGITDSARRLLDASAKGDERGLDLALELLKDIQEGSK